MDARFVDGERVVPQPVTFMAAGSRAGPFRGVSEVGAGNLRPSKDVASPSDACIRHVKAPARALPDSQAHSTRGPSNQSPQTPIASAAFQSAPSPDPADMA